VHVFDRRTGSQLDILHHANATWLGTSISTVLEVIVKSLLLVAAIAFVHQNLNYEVSSRHLPMTRQSLPSHISVTRAFSVNAYFELTRILRMKCTFQSAL
jgi:hypothetical protein